MRQIIWLLLVAVTLAFPLSIFAAENSKMHKVVFELTTENTTEWEGVLNNVENLQKAFEATNTEIEIVAHGKGLGLLRTTNSSMAERLTRIAGAGVSFAACNNTMQRMKLTKQDLFPFVIVVDSGVAEVVRKQEAGWAYIKGGV